MLHGNSACPFPQDECRKNTDVRFWLYGIQNWTSRNDHTKQMIQVAHLKDKMIRKTEDCLAISYISKYTVPYYDD